MGLLCRTFCFTTVLLGATSFAFASSNETTLPDSATLAQMEARAEHAQPREQCFLYTQLISTMTEIAGHEMLAGNEQAANSTLQQIQHYAGLVHLQMRGNARRLMNAQLLMHQTTRRLDQFAHRVSYDERPPMEATLQQLTQIEDELMTQVFNRY